LIETLTGKREHEPARERFTVGQGVAASLELLDENRKYQKFLIIH